MPTNGPRDEEVKKLVHDIVDPIIGDHNRKHSENRKDIHDLRGIADANGNRLTLVEYGIQDLRKDFGRMEATVMKLDATADRFEALVNKEDGRHQAKKELMEGRDRNIADSSKRALWAAVAATIVAALLAALLGVVLTNKEHAKIFIGADPTVAQYTIK
jgi:hypothetical protein